VERANSAQWTQAINRVDNHVPKCKSTMSGCERRLVTGMPDCKVARRLMRTEDKARNAYLNAGGAIPPQ